MNYRDNTRTNPQDRISVKEETETGQLTEEETRHVTEKS
jgi:hypothetical protein